MSLHATADQAESGKTHFLLTKEFIDLVVWYA